MSDVVYVLTNQAMPRMVKIGWTTRSAEVRMNDLLATGVPVPFECAIAIEVKDGEGSKIEKALSTAFAPNRVNLKREFYELESEQVEAILRVLPGKDVTPQIEKETESLDVGDRESLANMKRRRPNFNFTQMGIPIGAVLASVDTEEEATVTNDSNQVRFRDEEMSLTAASKKVWEVDYGVAPCPRWKYGGRRLSDIYEETYGTRPV